VNGCSSNGIVYLPCYAAPNVTCGGAEYDLDTVIFCKPHHCRFIRDQRYSYFVAVALSLFMGMFGIDRFYLGYPALGLLKLFTVGFFFVGQLVDFILILVQAVGPSDRSGYYTPFYGPLIFDVNNTDTYITISGSTCL
jgi:TM2 domain-containing membrane protein YozV